MSKTPEAEPHTVFIGAIVCAPDGRVLCQLRDNYPWIICPGMWCCCPGGHLETGEQPEEAVLRELTEEFEIEVSGLTSLVKHVESSVEFRGIYHSFVAKLVTPVAEVKCNEGVRAEFFPPEIAIGLPQHPVSRLFLRAYMERFKVAA